VDLLDELAHGDEGKLYVEDALLAIAVCAAKVDEQYSSQEIERIVALARANKIFRNKPETIKKTVFRLVNSMRVSDRQGTLDRAVNSLPEELKETGLAWAGDVLMANGIPLDESREFMTELATKLSVDSETTRKIIHMVYVP
jgi:hypothetical protein